MKKKIKVFHRKTWKPNPKWPDGREPHFGRSFTITYCETPAQAQDICRVWNANNDPGKYEDRAEWRYL